MMKIVQFTAALEFFFQPEPDIRLIFKFLSTHYGDAHSTCYKDPSISFGHEIYWQQIQMTSTQNVIEAVHGQEFIEFSIVKERNKISDITMR